ncbi:MAG TPA: thiamine pyrophosphate-dependent enzyme, partial [Polyangiaceae bacterium]|nr:thiamine pyrophosphate-dependent enzyme [Polyangiaceae bacterium]
DQIKLFGDSARAFFEFGAPDPAPSALAGVVRHVAHALHRAQFPDPGPVQLNLRARKPLEPSASLDADSLALHQAVDDLLARGPTRVENPTVHADVTRLADACRDATRGLIVVGPRAACAPEAARALLRLSEVTSFPLLCESASQLRFAPELTRKAARIDGFEWILSHERQRERLRPELVLSFGAPPVSGAYERFLAGFSGARFVVARHGFADPHGIANELICADDADVADRVCAELERRTPSHGARAQFTLDWLAANADAWRAVDDELRRETAVLSEPLAVRTVLEHLPDPCTLVLGNSLPIREVDAYAPCASRRVRVLSQRGANGIDGLISGAAGAASLSHEPVLLLLGDVSFMHDLGGLAAARESRAPLIIVVIDNGGGRIFEQLPFAAEFEKDPQLGQFWLTPPHADFAHAAAVFGHQYERLSTVSEIAPALRDAKVRRGASVLHLVVDGSSARAAGARIRAALSQTWG